MTTIAHTIAPPSRRSVWRRLAEAIGRRLAGDGLAEAQRQAAQAEARLKDAVEAIPEGLVMLDPEGRYILWNQTYADIYHDSATCSARAFGLSIP